MNGPIAQAASLVCHANGALAGKAVADLLAENSAFRFCESVEFVRLTGPDRSEHPVAATPNAWIESLVAGSARRVWLTRQPSADPPQDHMLAGFVGGGGNWWLVTERTSGECVGWMARWVVGNGEAADRRIWRVTYGNSGPARRPSYPGEHDVVAASRNRLKKSLDAIELFARAHADGAFAETFQKALATLESGVRSGYHQDLAPEGALAPPAAELLDACQSAWVFGGMGSWNDRGFPGAVGREFERVSVEHFDAVCEAIAVAASSSGRER